MRLSYKWLQEYVDIRMPPESLRELLTMSGLAVDSVTESGGDHIFDIEVTSNRPDCLSVLGIAREVAALTGKKLKTPYAEIRRTPYAMRSTIKITVEDKKLCPLYTGRIVQNVKVASSSRRLEDTITAMDLRPVNNIVDITNFCLFETGEPMHAFDLDRIAGGTVVVRRGRKGEKIKTIDGVERALDETMLVIADADKPIAIAGIIGGLDSQITPSTKNILLEAAIFDPVSVRRTSRRLGISTESSYRFERRVNPEAVGLASNRACELILKEAGGRPGALVEVGRRRPEARIIELRPSRLNAVIGEDIPPSRIREILASLGCGIKASSKDILRIEVPSFRQDIGTEIDLVEEVVRIYGYNKIPTTIPPVPVDSSTRVPIEMEMDNSIRRALVSCGLFEILTYGLLSKKDLARTVISESQTVDVENPLSAEQEAMRPNLIPGLLKVVGRNINRREEYIALFEIGKVYSKEGSGGLAETKHLSLGVSGIYRGNWETPPEEMDFFYLKGILETLFNELGIEGMALASADHPAFEKGACASINFSGGTKMGVIGEVSKDLLDSFDIKERVYAAEMSLEEVLKKFKPYKRHVEAPKYPSSTRDISIIVDKGAQNARIMRLIKERGGVIVRNIQLLDCYSGRQIPDGKIGLTYRVEYRDPSRTLEDSVVNAAHAAIVDGLGKELGAKLR